MAQVLLAVKTFLPRPNPGWIERPEISGRLDAVLSHRVSLLSAPAGSGKTSALTAWLARQTYTAAWLAIDPADNDPVRFWTYICAAVRVAQSASISGEASSFGTAALARLHSGGAEPSEETLDGILNELAALPEPLILILDDYHRITAQTLHAGLAYWIERLPPQIHLVLATRADPPLPLALLRARGELVEIRAASLRFSTQETDTFFEKTSGLRLAADQISALDQRTEGWVASLQMAALALKSLIEESRPKSDTTDIAREFIASFSGRHAYVLDFFLEEVLNHQSPEVQDFLLRTSILERMSAELCDSLPGGPAQGSNGQALLERIYRANLFLVPLDTQRTWFRYHHLFADLLRSHLHEQRPGLEAELHAAAAAWFEPRGLIDEALHHALAGKDWERAAHLVATHWRTPVEAGEYDTAEEWFQSLPAGLMRSRPRLALSFCWVLWLKGKIHRLEEWLDAAQTALRNPKSVTRPDYLFDVGQSTLMRAIVLRHNGDFTTSLQAAEQTVTSAESLPPSEDKQDQFWGLLFRGVAHFHLGESLRMLGEAERAIPAFEHAVKILAPYSPVAVSGAYYNLCTLLILQGRLRQAGDTARRALAYAANFPVPNLPAFAQLHVAAAEVAYECGEENEVDLHPARADALGRGSTNAIRYGAYLRLRRIHAPLELRRAEELLHPVETLFNRMDASYLLTELAAMRARAWVLSGEHELAAEWARSAVIGPETGKEYPRKRLEILAYARLLLAQREAKTAAELLSDAISRALAISHTGAALEFFLLRAAARYHSHDAAGSTEDLVQALEIAAPEGFCRIFLDEGEGMRDLLSGLSSSPAARRPGPAVRRFLDQLLADFALTPAAQHPNLPEALTEREMDVLRLLAAGLSNRKIGTKLYLTEGTVKTHVHNLLGKLGVANRGQVVAKAREMEII